MKLLLPYLKNLRGNYSLVGQVVNLRADCEIGANCAGKQPARRMASCPTRKRTHYGLFGAEHFRGIDARCAPGGHGRGGDRCGNQHRDHDRENHWIGRRGFE